MPKRILIADDHATARQALRTAVSQREDWQVCAEAADGADAVEKAKTDNPDVVLIDLAIGGLNGFEAAEEIRAICPKAVVLAVSMHDPRALLTSLQQIGVRGFVSKARIGTDLVPAIEATLAGRTWFRECE